MNEEIWDSKLVSQVAKVIGYNNAIVELSKVPRKDYAQALINSFDWSGTPQGHGFWSVIQEGFRPKKYNGGQEEW